MRIGKRPLPGAWLSFVAGLVLASVALSLIGWLLASTPLIVWGNALASQLTQAGTSKWISIAVVNLLASAMLIRLMLATRWAEHVRKLAFAAIGLGILGGAAFNLLKFSDIDRSEPYRLRAEQLPTLAELAFSMPDKYPAREVLVWLRQHAAGAEITASVADLQSAGLASHRLLGVAHLQVRARKNAALSVATANRELKRFHVVGAAKPVWIDIDQARPHAKLCAVLTVDALLLVSSADAPGCEAIQ